ncbi:MAG TPA: hypothetical protein PKB06_07780, partial [Actinotalea sp.]|nr:hypothetical protein [Actinotalea sp.]
MRSSLTRSMLGTTTALCLVLAGAAPAFALGGGDGSAEPAPNVTGSAEPGPEVGDATGPSPTPTSAPTPSVTPAPTPTATPAP